MTPTRTRAVDHHVEIRTSLIGGVYRPIADVRVVK